MQTTNNFIYCLFCLQINKDLKRRTLELEIEKNFKGCVYCIKGFTRSTTKIGWGIAKEGLNVIIYLLN